ncbi:LLM class flavin-dependent oxidoreductase [Nocardia sp. CDC160]|uniref:LLM class flavin-dependent oxidoreductase n=1 Tax=Nocardia sp. CDC160 TaxID=3112166 RepID=UPI002DB92E87|nr:LLM class flavin-dependent oxidoreductase [Nocardia sp. CDC160]MEC3917296.1 LLM class flavin-dependent oxidoreductase [Nocardia sp. CDC160]
MTNISFGLKTTPMRVEYRDILRVWEEADDLPEIADAWLWDHLLPLSGPPNGPILEGWTLLSALAARTRRLGLGLLVTSNRIREPAVLGKIASTVDAISGGRLIMGLGVGGTRQPADTGGIPGPNPAETEYAAYGLPLVSPAEGLARLSETIRILENMWTEPEFDFHGRYYTLEGNRNEPKPARRPRLLLGGWGNRTLRLIAEHADLWNIPGPPHNDLPFLIDRARALDTHCAALGRNPSDITRSVQYIVDYDDPTTTRHTVLDLIGAGFTHVVLSLRAPYPDKAAIWLAENIITPVRDQL